VSLRFLLEIGTEEIPDWMIPGALESLAELAVQELGVQRLSYGSLRTDGTPRRLVLQVSALPDRQPTATQPIQGPAQSAPQQAILGFARKHGVALADLHIQSTAKGTYYVYYRMEPGLATGEVLAKVLPGIIDAIVFPKTMYWKSPQDRFIRPIRWIVALLGNEVVPFEVAGVRSGNETSGHRRLGAARVPVTVETYEQQLRENGVILSADERRAKIMDGITALGVRLKPDPALLETLVYLTEYPTPIAGGFDPQFLELPEEVLITVMRHHQKYFSVEDASGHLAPRFVAVMNTNADPQGLVQRGNERVLRARFNDARFFWQTDQHKKLADRVEDLGHVTFQAKLGTYLEKTTRVESLVKELGGNEHAARAARLAKCDLTTELVKEFTELQGVVGGLYARAQGEPEEVWQAIYDHYKPESMEDRIPRNTAGRLLSAADKLDTLGGCFRVGLIPTGSRDPFALRRAAQGIVKILVEGKLRLPLRRLLEGNAALEEFVLDRVRYYFKDIRGFRYDEVNAILASGWDDLVDVESRLQAIQAVRPTENFEPLAASFKRIQNILRQAQFSGGGEINRQLLEPGPEDELYREFERVRQAAATQEYQPALETIASIRPKVDRFFDKVLVNAPDERIRQNRLMLLHTLLAEFSTIADFSEIVTNS
jgi:glycyl-tRNA synthetase beta chain